MTTQTNSSTRTTFGLFVLVTLAAGQDHELYQVDATGLEMFQGYLDHVDTDIWSAYRAQVQEHCSAHTSKFHPEQM